jgi:hypothetical protein
MTNYVLIAHPRTASSWVKNHFQQLESQKFLGEYFSPDNMQPGTFKKDYNQLKIDFLEESRVKGTEYFIKYMVEQIDNFPDWFTTFYKDYEKIKLLNTDVWGVFLSYGYQCYIGWNNTGLYKRPTEIKEFNIFLPVIQTFAKSYSQYIRYDNYDTLFDIKDISTKTILKHIGIPQYDIKSKRHVHNYELKLKQNIEMTKLFLKDELRKNNNDMVF